MEHFAINNALAFCVAADLMYGGDNWFITPAVIITKPYEDKEKTNISEEENNRLKNKVCATVKELNDIREKNDNQKKTIHEMCNSLIELRKDYDALEQKYWDAQRLIDKYASENEEVVKERDKNNLNNIKLRNDLTIQKIEFEEQKRYLEAYQKLYIKEAMKNTKLEKERG